ncbi:phage tail length tape measure family protein [Citrobacter braakii]|uniref:phage tail length tape measure family protein n=1 Tax=Citrobacter braakii TaxID=57706 RepID=UPI003524CB40
MMSNNLDLSLRITADLNAARQSIKDISGDVASLAQSVNKADAQWQHSGKSAEQSAKASEDAWTRQTAFMNQGQRQIVQEEKLRKAQEGAAAAAEKQRVENEKLSKELQNVLGKIDPVTRALSKLDAQEEKLRKLNREGILDDNSFSNYLAKINDQRNAINLLTGKTQTLQVNSKAARNEFILLARQLASGNISGAAQNFYNLGSRVGALPRLFSAAGIATGGFLALFVAAGSTLVSLSRDQDAFTRSIISTGNYAGLTAGQLEVMAQKSGKLSSNYGAARDILNGLIRNGKLTADALNNASQAAASLAEITGNSSSQIISEFSAMSDSAARWANEIDSKYHLLDLATLSRIRSLENQGKKEEAIELASAEINRALKGRITELRNELSGLAAGWENVKRVVNEIKQGFRSGVSIATGQESDAEARAREIDAIQKRLDSAGDETDIARRGDGYAKLIKQDRERLALLKQEEVAENLLASATGERTRAEEAGKKAYKELSELWDKNKTAIEIESDATEALRQQYEKLWSTHEGKEILESRGVTSDDGVSFSGGQWDIDSGKLSESTKAAEQYNSQLEKTLNTTRGLTQLEKTQAEIRTGNLKDATEEEQQKALELAKRIDAQNKANEAERSGQQQIKRTTAENERYVDSLVNQVSKQAQSAAAIRVNEIATRNLTDEQKKAAQAAHELLTAREYADQNFALRLQLMQASGDEAGASLEEVRKKYSDLKNEFESSGNTEGLALIDQLLPIEETKVRIDQIKKEIEDLYNYQSQREQSIQAQIVTGAISEYNGRQQILELHKQTAAKLEEYLPVLQEMSDIPGEAGENIRGLLAQLETQLGNLSKTGSELTQAFKDGLQGGIESSLIGLSNGTMKLSDAVKNLALEIVNSLAKIAAQQLAMAALSGLTGGIGAGALFGGFFSDGGQVRGAGTTTSDSIPVLLSDEEFITRSAVVNQPGALEFLNDFNRRGMSALNDWTRHASGGLAGFPAPINPSTVHDIDSTERATDPAGYNIQQTLVFDAGDALTAGINTLAGQRSLITWVRANQATLKQLIGE